MAYSLIPRLVLKRNKIKSNCTLYFADSYCCKTIYFVTLACFSVILTYPHSLFSHFTISSVMTAVTFPLRPPRLAFAICGRRCMTN